ncbi:uncharacterized protein Dwil_GK23780 [Drosophila willistoni]|uniref:Protein sleepless n=1 Tax=Drosophila willistoni TaxID=7260 RepID=B4MTR5_DROWI|nr:uncharacterized protein LOC6641740 [Drosophila willistoni]EDW75504.2 uncharacterized protein Dwil_GK23780 [Drosophila willistoni]
MHPISMKSIAIILFLISCCISKGSAIECYVCDSTDNPSCADLDSNSSIVAENCTLDKMRSLNTWLLDLNKFSYFDNGAGKNPLMNCQKVVAREPVYNRVVTARFCQLDTGDSDACAILRSKMGIPQGNQQGQGRGKRDQLQARKGQQGGYDSGNYGGQADNDDSAPKDEFFCEICKTDRCNGAAAITLNLYTGSIMMMAMMMRAMRIFQLGC